MKELKNVAEYNDVSNQDKPVLLDFYADWCGPCQALLPTVEKLSEKFKDEAVIAKVNVDKNPELAQQFQVRSIPALFFIKNGEIVEQLVGNQSESFLTAKLNEHTGVSAA